MSFSKNVTIVLGLVVCTAMTGCGGSTMGEDLAEIRSLLGELKEIKTQTAKNASTETPTQAPEEAALEVEVVQEEVVQEAVVQEAVVTQVPEQSPAPIAGQINWEPAGFYEDGTVMSMDEISHYNIVFGTEQTSLTDSVELSIAGLLTYDFSANNTGDTWFVGVQTVSIYGGVSETSNLMEFGI